MEVDTSGWVAIGGTSQFACFEAAPGVMVLVPREGARDTAETARESVAFQDAYWARVGRRGCVAVLVDGVLDQDAGARHVYAEETRGALTVGLALIGGTPWGRAIASVLIRVKAPSIPTRLFATLEDAMPWIDRVNQAARDADGA